MPGDYYCKLKGRLFGPVSAKHLRYLARYGRLAATDLVRRGESDDWHDAGSLSDLFARAKQQPARSSWRGERRRGASTLALGAVVLGVLLGVALALGALNRAPAQGVDPAPARQLGER